MKTIRELMGLEEADKMKDEDPCWDTHQMVGMKMKNGKKVPNCVPRAKPKNEEVEIAEAKVGDTVSFHHELKSATGSKVKKSGTVEKVDGDVVHVKVKDKYGVKRHQIKMGDLVKEDTELEEASRSLPSHLQKLIKNKNLDKKPMTMVTPSQKEKLKSTVKDVTPKGYGPNEEVEMDEGMLDAVKGAAKGVAKRVADSAKSTAVGFVHGAIDSATSHSPILRHAGNKLHRVVKKKLGEETEQIDEISAEVKQKYLAAATKKHLQQFLGRAPVRDKQELDKRRAAIQNTSKELTGKTHYQEEVEVEESKKIPASGKPVDPKDLVVSLKDVPVKKPRGHTQYDPSKEFPGVKALKREETELELDELRNVTQDQLGGRMGSSGPGFNKTPAGKAREVKRKQDNLKSQMQFTKSQGGIAGPKGKLPEEVEIAEEAPPIQVRATYTQSYAKHHKTGKKPSEAVASAYADVAKKHGYDMVQKLKAHHASNEGVETAAQVTKHFEKGQSTPSGVPKWVAIGLKDMKKKKKVEEASDAELMGGAVSKPTAPGNNSKLADKFMKAMKKMRTSANISCKTVGMVSTCEDMNDMFTEAMKKEKKEATSKDTLEKGQKLSGKQETITINPELKNNKGVA